MMVMRQKEKQPLSSFVEESFLLFLNFHCTVYLNDNIVRDVW